MTLPIGTRRGPYEIIAMLGAGGMGEVYQARDTRLGRIVALKVAKSQFSERFEREARTVAALNHPHICQLFDVGPDYIVMEFVEGEAVWRPPTLEKLIELALQIADGLAAAHAAGVIHRDLKPANILVNRAEQVKILDFGLAVFNPWSADASAATTVAGTMTDTGTAVGTAAYMSPEQARGEVVDARTDLWSFGVVLYELATGTRPFEGATSPVIFEALLSRAPVPVRDKNPSIPIELERIIARLLEKDREVRYQSAADVRADLKRLRRDVSPSSSRAEVATAPRSSRMRWPLVVGGLALVAAMAILVAIGLPRLSKTSGPVTSPSEYVQITDLAASAAAPSLSADGSMVTFLSGSEPFRNTGQVYVKILPNGESKRLTNTPYPKYAPVFTPDGSRIAYTEQPDVASWDTWTVPVLGGPPTRLLPNASGLIWIDETHVLFSEIMGEGLHMGIATATESRAGERILYFPDHERAMAHFSYRSPDRRWVLIAEMDRTATWLQCRLMPFDGSSFGRRVGPPGACRATAWSPDGRWMYFSVRAHGGSRLWRQAFPDGMPEQITSGPTDEEGIAVAPDGRSLITSIGRRQSSVWIHDASGDRQVSPEGFASFPRFSADARRLYFLLRVDPASDSNELRSIELASGTIERVLPGVAVNYFDISNDDREVVYTTRVDGVSQAWLASLDRRQAPRAIAREAGEVSFAGDDVVFTSLQKQTNSLMRVSKAGGEPVQLLSSIVNKGFVSPDGRFVLVGVPGTGGRAATETVAMPTAGGTPVKICAVECGGQWSRNGRYLYVGGSTTGGDGFAIPIPEGRSLPALKGVIDFAHPESIPTGSQSLRGAPLVLGADPSTYAYMKTETPRNLYRIPLH